MVGARLADTRSAQGVSLNCYSQDGKVKCCHTESSTAPQAQLPKMLTGDKNLAKKLRQWYQFTVASLYSCSHLQESWQPGALCLNQKPHFRPPQHDQVLTMAAMNEAG